MKTMLLVSILLTGLNAYAVKITNLELYQRCHAHLVGDAVKLSDPILFEIKNNRISGVDACKDLLKSAQLSGNNPLPKANIKGIKVLENLFKVHANWFESKTIDGDLANGRALYEASPGGLYYTKALFDPSFTFADMFKGTTSLEAIRSDGSPARTNIRNLEVATFRYRTDGSNSAVWSGLVLPQVGDLEGIRPQRQLNLANFRGRAGNSPFNGSLGGGVLGNRNYVMRTTKERGFRSDGAVQTPRRWGRSIFVDFLCQDVPVINIASDTTPYVDPMSSTAFRTTAGCVSCHASMDQLAGLVRNYSTAEITPDNINFQAPFFHPITIPAAPYEWKANGDRDYFQQAAKGKFYYRTIDGELIDRNVDNLNALGNLLSQTDDVYICAASRYLEHFTGIKYPMNKVAANSSSTYSQAIRSLATDLKADQDPMKLIEKILSSEIYSDSKFKAGE
jgi:hypothetical protein